MKEHQAVREMAERRRALADLQVGDAVFVVFQSYTRSYRVGRVERRTPKQVVVSTATGSPNFRLSRRFWLHDGSEFGAKRSYSLVYLTPSQPTDIPAAAGEDV